MCSITGCDPRCSRAERRVPAAVRRAAGETLTSTPSTRSPGAHTRDDAPGRASRPSQEVARSVKAAPRPRRQPAQVPARDRHPRHQLRVGPAGTGKTPWRSRWRWMRSTSRACSGDPGAPGGRGRRSWASARRPDPEGRPCLRPLYDAPVRDAGVDKVARLLEKNVIEIAPPTCAAHAQRCLRHPRRGAEHHDRADEDVPDPPSASAARRWSPAT